MKKSNFAKKFIGFTLVLLIMTAAFAIQISASDYEDNWAKGAIDSLIAQNIIAPDANGDIRPYDDITRAETIDAINRAFNFSKTATINYTDVSSGDSFYKDVQIAVAAGYMPNIGSSSEFRPYDFITREEMMIILARVIELQPNTSLVDMKYDDADVMSSEGKGALGALMASSVKIADNMGDSFFYPQDTIKRNLAFALISKASNYYNDLQLGRRQYSTITTDASIGSDSALTKNFHDVTMSGKNSVLENVIVWGNLTIDRAVGSETITIKNVTVKGNVFIYGGGFVNFVNTKITKSITVDKTNNSIELNISGTSSVDEIIANSGVSINAPSLTLTNITLTDDVSRGAKVGIDTRTVRTLTVQSAGINLTIDTSTIDELVIAKGAAGTLVDITKGSTVSKATINAVCDIKGSGTLLSNQINTTGTGSTISVSGRTSSSSSASSSSSSSSSSSTVQSASYITYSNSSYYPYYYNYGYYDYYGYYGYNYYYSYSDYSTWFYSQYGSYPSYDQYTTYINTYYPNYNYNYNYNLSYPYTSYEEYVTWYRSYNGYGYSTPTLDDYYRAVYNAYGYYPYNYNYNNYPYSSSRTVSTIADLQSALNAGVTNITLSAGYTISLDRSLTIYSGYTLTVASGTTLRLNGYTITVNGTLYGSVDNSYGGYITGGGSWPGYYNQTSSNTVSTAWELANLINNGVTNITISGGAVYLDRNITIYSGYNVTIASGTTLYLGNYVLTVNGSLSGYISQNGSGYLTGSGTYNGSYSGSWGWNSGWGNYPTGTYVNTPQELGNAITSGTPSIIIPYNVTITLTSGYTIPSGVTIYNYGTITSAAAITINNSGAVYNYGTISSTISNNWIGNPIR